MPLRPAKPNRPTKKKSGPGPVGGQSDEPDFESSSADVQAEEELSRSVSSFRYDKENNDDKGDGNDRDERRLKKVFSMATSETKGSPTAGVNARAFGSRTQGLNKPDKTVQAPLPDIRSMRDMLHLIQSSSVADPSGKSLPLLLRRINAAVLQNKISLPRIDKISDAREMLIEIFGKGHQGTTPLTSTQRSLHAMLPLWLLNLGRERTPTQQMHAAARLSLPRMHYHATD